MNESVDEVLDSCPYIINASIECLDDFAQAVESTEKVLEIYCKLLDSGDISHYSHDIQQNDFLEENGRICKNKSYLEKMEQEIEQLRSSEKKLLISISNKEKQSKKAELKISNINKKKEGLLEMRDKVQISKILTNTTFAYKRGSVRGFVVGPISTEIYPFEFNKKNESTSEITNHLYDLLKKASLETKSNEGPKRNENIT